MECFNTLTNNPPFIPVIQFGSVNQSPQGGKTGDVPALSHSPSASPVDSVSSIFSLILVVAPNCLYFACSKEPILDPIQNQRYPDHLVRQLMVDYSLNPTRHIVIWIRITLKTDITTKAISQDRWVVISSSNIMGIHNPRHSSSPCRSIIDLQTCLIIQKRVLTCQTRLPSPLGPRQANM
jgi:hypothetical protein